MRPSDPLTGPFFGETQDGLVFFPFGNRDAAVPVTPSQVEPLRSATVLATFALVALLVALVTGGAVMILLTLLSGHVPVVFGINLFWLLPVLVGLVFVTATLYDANVRRILKKA